MNGYAEIWFRTVSSATIQGGLFVVVVWALCLLAKKLPAWVKAWLWTIACGQFLIRMLVAVPLPLLAPAEGPVSNPVSARALPQNIVTESLGNRSTYERGLEVSFSRTESEPYSSQSILLSLWLLGIAAGCIGAAARLWAASRMVNKAGPLDSPLAQLFLNDLLPTGRNGASNSPIRLLQSSAVKCPLLTGYRNPAIIFPQGFTEESTEAELRMALAHEVAHIRRHDQWLAIIVAITQIVFFFHPLAWLAAREAALAREEACDYDVLLISGETPAAYAHFLVKSAQARTPVAAMGAAYGYRSLRRRITMIKRSNPVSKSTLRRTWLALIAAVVATAIPWTVVAQSGTQNLKPAPSKPAKNKPARAHRAPKNKPAVVPARAAHPGLAKLKPAVAPVALKPATAQGLPQLAKPARDANAPAAPMIPSVASGGSLAPRSNDGRPVAIDVPPARSQNAVSLAEKAADAPPIPQYSNDQGYEIARTGDKRVSVKLTHAYAERAIVDLLTTAGYDFVIKAKIEIEIVTCRLTNTPALDALRMILNGMDQHLTYRVEGDVVFIENAH